MAQNTSLFMSDSLLRALTDYYWLVEMATIDPSIVVPPEFDFVPEPRDDLESMIWVLTYAIIIHHQASLKGFRWDHYKRYVVDRFYGSLSYSALATERCSQMVGTMSIHTRELENWFPDPAQREWFKRAMALVAGGIMPSFNGNIVPITFDAFDALCNEFITDT